MIGPIYFVTDPSAPLTFAAQARAAARGGASTIQLREKTLPDAELIPLARGLKDLLAPRGIRLIVNDRIEVARAADADGLHIGQGDGDPREARAALGPGKLLGLSVENADQLAAIPEGAVDYLGVGPVRATATKPDHAPPIGFDGLARIVAATPLPCVAIGGVGPGDMAAVRASGAVGAAMVSAISRAPDPEAATRSLLAEWRAS
ncbi:thiamine phosphate synthase [Pontivivens ytuae]|uniref:Thiamine-phosphate synthase n=1 Tax=Pontivivens ytuae TaxID=2789856 RepID=A0A7S9LPX5_9RHOB|nr:thiamine phosphate synthase [Pontivivens ytuae]QPH52795.1 thiamine phosphate synthase [Pontivivens ytuae]